MDTSLAGQLLFLKRNIRSMKGLFCERMGWSWEITEILKVLLKTVLLSI